MEALNNNGEKAKMLVRDKQSDCLTVVGLAHPLLQQLYFLWERLTLFFHLRFSRKHLFHIDMANAGTDITTLPEFKEADLIHLSWINQGMLSLHTIRKILKSGKPVVWTMHDLWPLSSICHLSLECKQFKTHCANCMYLPGGGSARDLSYKVWERKKRVYDTGSIFFVACSRWLAGEAKASGLRGKHMVECIPNPINTSVFCIRDKAEARQTLGLPADKRLILFVAQRATNANKGMDYLVEACHQLVGQHPEMRDNTAVMILGGHAEDFENTFDMPVYPLGYVNDEEKMVEVYNAADLFVLPSLSENLPNTIMEAMACGVPCVGFKVGGIPEMIDHQRNGFVAAYKDASHLATGIRWVLCEADYASLSQQARHKVVAAYSQRTVALKYIELYNQALAFKRCNL
jgi:glycosyltransferase involved in cell wall biosynthesis